MTASRAATGAAAEQRREPVSIICVFNDPDVRAACLDRSIDAHRRIAPDVDYIPVDNTSHSFASAGAALNHGASLARHDHLVFVHQDVYLHSIPALERAAGVLAGSDIGILGPVGVAADGRILGRMRDRVVLIGDPTPSPVDVDSLDEVLFMIPRTVWQHAPLVDEPDLAWHAYAVEYGLRLRGQGLRTVALDLPITHNSLTVNLERLDVAHRTVARRYPHLLPVRTTCGVVRLDAPPVRTHRLIAPHRWRYRWLRDSQEVRRARTRTGGAPFVRSDIRLDIDDVLRAVIDPPLTVVNVVRDSTFGEDAAEPLSLPRRDREVVLRACPPAGAAAVVAGLDPRTSLLVTNLTLDDLESVRPATAAHLFGYHEAMGYWLLAGPATTLVPRQWTSRRARPLGVSTLAQ